MSGVASERQAAGVAVNRMHGHQTSRSVAAPCMPSIRLELIDDILHPDPAAEVTDAFLQSFGAPDVAHRRVCSDQP